MVWSWVYKEKLYDLKLYAKDIKQLDSLVQTVRIFSNDIGMEFGIQKCGMVELKRGKMIQSNGIDLPEGQKLNHSRKAKDTDTWEF